MTALTRPRGTPYQDAGIIGVPVASGVMIFQGSLVAANNNGHAVPGAGGTDLRYIGRAERTVDNATGSAGAILVEVRRNKAFKWANDGSISQSDLMAQAFIVDDQTVSGSDAGGTRSPAGVIIGIDPDGVWIE